MNTLGLKLLALVGMVGLTLAPTAAVDVPASFDAMPIPVTTAVGPDGGLTCGIHTAKLQSDGTPVTLECKVATVGKGDFTKKVPQFAAGVNRGNVQSNDVTEASGIAASRKNANVLWLHNDSGDSARVFAMSTSGAHLGTYNLSGVTARDWEDIAVGPGPTPGESYLYIGDIGDNNAAYTTVFIYRVAEPSVSSTQQPVNVNLSGVEKFTLKYEDGPRDAETLMVDPTNGDLYILSKRVSRSKVYRVPASDLVTGTTITMHAVAELPWGWATGGDISPDGSEVIVRGYNNASLWRRPPGGKLWDAFGGTQYPVPLASEPQGEAICFDSDGRGYYTTSEGAHQPLYYYARAADQTSAFIYISEPQRYAGIRVAVAPNLIPGLQRGSIVDVQGTLETTPDGERQIAGATVTVRADSPSPLSPLGMKPGSLGGGDFGNPESGVGQYGMSNGFGPNTIGLLARMWGRVSYMDPSGAYFIVDDGCGTSVRVDTSLVYLAISTGDLVGVSGISSLARSGHLRLPLLVPRSDSDIAAERP
ncbi:MAG: hypothetical protein ACP5R5_03210 [Armatimonadota bacterium]